MKDVKSTAYDKMEAMLDKFIADRIKARKEALKNGTVQEQDKEDK